MSLTSLQGALLNTSRANLLSLATAGELDAGNTYILNDFNQGRLGACSILLRAIDSNSFSQEVTFSTTFDNEGWWGRYDITDNLLLELKDNLGNHLIDRLGASTIAFDWGNTNYTNCYLKNTTLTTTDNQATIVVNNLNAEVANINITGSSGTITNCHIIRSTINTQNTTINFSHLKADDTSSITVLNGTTLNLNQIILKGVSAINFGATAGVNTTTLSNGVISGNSGISSIGAGVGTGNLNMTGFQMINSATIGYQRNGATIINTTNFNSGTLQCSNSGPITILGATIESAITTSSTGTFSTSGSLFKGSTINHTAGNISIVNCSILNGYTFQKGGTSQATYRYSLFSGFGTLTDNRNGGVYTVTDVTSFGSTLTLSGVGIINLDNTNLNKCTITASVNCNLSGLQANISTINASVGGLNVSNSYLLSSTINKVIGAGTLIAGNNSINNSSIIANNVAGTLTINQNNILDSNITIANTAGNIGISRCEIKSSNALNMGAITVLTFNINDCKFLNCGVLSFNPGNTKQFQILSSVIENGGTLTIGAMLGAGNLDISDMIIANQGSISLTGINNAGALIISRLTAINSGSISLNGNATAFNRIWVDNSGVFTATGGSHQMIKVTDNATINGLAFTNSVVTGQSTFVQNLTANNTNTARDRFNNNLI